MAVCNVWDSCDLSPLSRRQVAASRQITSSNSLHHTRPNQTIPNHIISYQHCPLSNTLFCTTCWQDTSSNSLLCSTKFPTTQNALKCSNLLEQKKTLSNSLFCSTTTSSNSVHRCTVLSTAQNALHCTSQNYTALHLEGVLQQSKSSGSHSACCHRLL